MAVREFGKVGVLMGGPSSEREISLKSGKAVLEALKSLGLDAIAIDIKTDSREENIKLIKLYNLDCAFVALHGYFGEDGRIQDILGTIGVAYTGSGCQASRLAMDKAACKRIFKAKGLNIPGHTVLEANQAKDEYKLFADLHFPLVVKPASHGSSIGLSIVDREEGLRRAIESAFNFDKRIIIEQYIRGRELTVGILEEEPLAIIEIVPKKRFFDYEAKYRSGMADYIVPAVLKEDIAERVRQASLTAHQALGCYGCSRVDIILDDRELPFILEVNSIPGFTSTSLLPKAAKYKGIEFPELCLKLIELAYLKHKEAPVYEKK